MENKKKTKRYIVYSKLIINAGVEVTARGLEEAVAKAREMNEEDFIDFKGEYIDGSMDITGVYET